MGKGIQLSHLDAAAHVGDGLLDGFEQEVATSAEGFLNYIDHGALGLSLVVIVEELSDGHYCFMAIFGGIFHNRRLLGTIGVRN